MSLLSFSSRKEPDSDLPTPVYAALIESLYEGSLANVFGTVGTLLMVAYVWTMAPRLELGATLAVLSVACVVRIAAALLYVFQRLASRDQPFARTKEEIASKEGRFMAVAVFFTTSLGILNYEVFGGETGEDVRLLVFAVSVVVVFAASGRTAGSPRVAFWQFATTAGPFFAAMLSIHDALHLTLGAMGILAGLSLRQATRTLHRTLVKAMTAQRETAETAKILDTALNNMANGLVMFDANRKLLLANDLFGRMFNLDSNPVGRSVDDVMTQATESRETAEEILEFLKGVSGDNATIDMGGDRVLEFKIKPMELGSVMVVENVTAEREAEARIERMARYDAVTCLPNRRFFNEKLAEWVADHEASGRTFSILAIDLDRFKEVNDTLGHQAGDKLLAEAAARMRSAVGYPGFVARFGGDEFMVLLPTSDKLEIAATGMDIVKAVSQPYEIDASPVSVGTSIGAAAFPADAEDGDGESLMKASDMALYDAKASARGTLKFFVEDMAAAVRRKRRLGKALTDAVLNGEMHLDYQPIVDVQSGRTTAVEALMRWTFGPGNPVSPSEFIPIAEDSGVIVDLGSWALRKVCNDAVGWPGDVRVAVNLSAVQFEKGDIVETVVSALQASGLRPSRLELEITESVLIDNHDAAMEKLTALRGLGIRVALDDFGTGYSSLAYLNEFKFDKVKVDQSFVREVNGPKAAKATSIIKAVVAIARDFEMTTVVEGVETEDQLATLRGLGVKEVQGFLFSRPIAADDMGIWLLRDLAASVAPRVARRSGSEGNRSVTA